MHRHSGIAVHKIFGEMIDQETKEMIGGLKILGKYKKKAIKKQKQKQLKQLYIRTGTITQH